MSQKQPLMSYDLNIYSRPPDAGYALRLRGAVQENSRPGVRAAGHNQQLCMKEAADIHL